MSTESNGAPDRSGREPTLAARQAASTVGWSAVAQTARQGLQLISMIVLARLLIPEDFGLLRMAVVVTELVGSLARLGLRPALVQRADLDPRHESTAFYAHLLLGLFAALVVSATAYPLTLFFGDDRLLPVLTVMSISIFSDSLPLTHLAMLQRSLQFKHHGIVEVVMQGSSLVVAVMMAWLGFGVWSLVAGRIAPGVFGVVAAIPLKHLPLGRGVSLKAFRQLVSFGSHTAAHGLLDYAILNIDYVMLGRFASIRALGLYTFSFNLLQRPLLAVSNTVPHALFPVLCGVRDKAEGLIDGYLKSTHYVVLGMYPFLFGILAVAPEFVPLVFGEQWSNAVPIIQWICAAGAVTATGMLMKAVLFTLGRPDLLWKIGIARLAAYAIVLYLAAQRGATEVAAAVAILALPFHLLTHALLARMLSLSWLRYWRALRIPAIATGLMIAGVFGVRAGLVALGAPLWLVLIGGVAAGAAAYVSFVMIFDRPAIREILALLADRSSLARRVLRR